MVDPKKMRSLDNGRFIQIRKKRRVKSKQQDESNNTKIAGKRSSSKRSQGRPNKATKVASQKDKSFYNIVIGL